MENCKIVAEIGINHNGDMKLVKKLIDAAVLGNCNYVKFQKRNINSVYSEEELNQYRESPWGTTNREQKEGLELSSNDYIEIDKYCKEKNIEWFVSPWDTISTSFISSQFNIPFIKMPSALITNKELLKEIKITNKPVIISCGMSNKEEIDYCLSILGNQVKYILSCTASYPTPVEEMNMNRIKTLQKLYGNKYKIGFSNHNPGIIFILQAYLMGCEMIEFHITLDRSMYGSDQAVSIEPEGIYIINKYLKSIKKGKGNGNIECLPSEIPIRKKLRKL